MAVRHRSSTEGGSTAASRRVRRSARAASAARTARSAGSNRSPVSGSPRVAGPLLRPAEQPRRPVASASPRASRTSRSAVARGVSVGSTGTRKSTSVSSSSAQAACASARARLASAPTTTGRAPGSVPPSTVAEATRRSPRGHRVGGAGPAGAGRAPRAATSRATRPAAHQGQTGGCSFGVVPPRASPSSVSRSALSGPAGAGRGVRARRGARRPARGGRLRRVGVRRPGRPGRAGHPVRRGGVERHPAEPGRSRPRSRRAG